MKPHLNFTVAGYVVLRRDREQGNGGGVATFIREGIGFKVNHISSEFESLVWGMSGKFKIVNVYNPCNKLSVDDLLKMSGPGQGKALWCGDFNAHSTLWGSSVTDGNGLAVEEFLMEEGLVCLTLLLCLIILNSLKVYKKVRICSCGIHTYCKILYIMYTYN